MTYGRLAQLVEHLLDVQEVTGSSPVPSTTSPQTFWSGDFFRGGRYRTRTARPRRRRGNKHPSGVFVSARFPMRRNVYQERCRQTFWSGAFLLRHPLTHVGAGRYRTRTARPRRRRGNKHPSGVFVSARFLTRRNVYQERCRPTHSSRVFLFWWTVQDENRDKQRQGITIMGVSCLLIFLTRRGILGSVQQIGI